MGNNLSRTNYIKIDAKDIQETRLNDYAELTSVARNSRIEYVSDEYYGKAENLLKQQNPDTSHSLYQGLFTIINFICENLNINITV